MSRTKSPAADTADAPPKKSKLKTLLVVGGGALALLGAGVGAGFVFSSSLAHEGPSEDPNRPKLVERGNEPSGGGEGEDKAPVVKVGSVSVASDKVAVDPRKYEVTYIPLEQPFTANLANGGIVQVGLSFATYYDHRVVENVERQTVPIRSAALMVLSEQDPAVISTPAGKQMLQRQLTDATNLVLRQKEGFGGIDNVYFTSLVVQ